MLKSVSVRIRILSGFAVVILVMAGVNYLTSSSIGGLEGTARVIVDRTDEERRANDFAMALDRQISDLKTFALSGSAADGEAIQTSKSVAEAGRADIQEMLEASNRTDALEAIRAASEEFDRIFTEIESRAGNESDALQVIVGGLIDLNRNGAALQNRLQTVEGPQGGQVASQIREAIRTFEQDAIGYIASGTTSNFEKVRNSGFALSDVLDANSRLLPRRERRRFLTPVRRDRDNISQSIQSSYATADGLQKSLASLEEQASLIKDVAEGVMRDARQSQAASLRSMSDDISATVSTSVIGLAAGAAGSALLAWLIGLSISRPLGRITATVTALAEGDKTQEIPFQDRHDEIGSLSRAAAVFRERAFELEAAAGERLKAEQDAAETERLAREREEQRKEAAARERAAEREAQEQQASRARLDLADQFEARIMGVVGAVSEATGKVVRATSEIVDGTEATHSQVENTYGATGSAASNVEGVASATEELTASFSAINGELDRSAATAQDAVAETSRSLEIISSLASAADKIGSAVTLISNISEQTNLLALNATIESARAGEAGRGFAVVAGEVKNLANQSGNATAEIEGYVEEIQQVAREAEAAMKHINDVIHTMNDATQSVVVSIQEQSLATSEIARNISSVSADTAVARQNMESVEGTTNAMQAMTGDLQSCADELTRQAQDLSAEVTRFLADIRGAASTV